MTNVIGAGLFRQLGEDNVRGWLRGRLQRTRDRPVAIILNGWNARSGERIAEDVAELDQLCETNEIRLVFAMNSFSFAALFG